MKDRSWRKAVVRRADDHAGSESLVDIAVVPEGEGALLSARIVDHAAARPPRSRARSRRRAPVPGEHENGRRASSRARLVLRRLKGRGRKSSPSSVRMSKAYSWTSSSCLRECGALKSGTPSTPKDDRFAINELICSTPMTTRRVFANVSEVTGNSRIKMEGVCKTR